MDACLTEATPAAKTSSASSSAGINWPRWLGRAFALTLVVGLVWRLTRYLGAFPIWGDEAMVLLDVLDRDYLGLTYQLRYAQVAPLFFLWAERLAVVLFGASEWSVHLFPFLAGMIACVAFWRTCRVHLPSVVACLAVGVLAVSYYPVRHGCEAKPYVFDLCIAVLYLWLTLERLRNPEQDRWLSALVVMAPIAAFSSYPSVFVAGSVSLVLLPTMRDASWKQRSLYLLFNVLLLTAFVVHYGMIGHRQVDTEEATATRDFLRDYWKDAFPPDAWHLWPLWLLQAFTGNMLAYPMGAKHGGSTLTFLLVLIGSVAMWRNGRRSLLALCWLPFALNCLAACLKKYPFGESARITLHLAPFICVMMAFGLAQVLEWIRAPHWRGRTHLALYALLLGCGLVGVIRDLRSPYKTEHDQEVRRLARDLAVKAAGEPVLLAHSQEKELLAELVWYLRTESLDLHWQPEIVDANARSYWSVQFNHQELGELAPPEGWRIAESDVRCVPPENAKMAALYCRWARIVRE